MDDEDAAIWMFIVSFLCASLLGAIFAFYWWLDL